MNGEGDTMFMCKDVVENIMSYIDQELDLRTLEELEKQMTGDAFLGGGLLEGVAELLFHQAVDPLHFLLFTKLQTVVGRLATSLTVHTRCVGSPFDGALLGVATLPFEEELEILAPTQTTDASSVTSHSSSFLHAATFRRPTPVVRDRRGVFDQGDAQTRVGEHSQRGFTSGTRTVHVHLDGTHAVHLCFLDGVFTRQLRGKRCALAGTFEAARSGGRPAHHRTRGVGDCDDRVVEGRLDVNVPVGNVLFDLLFSALTL